MAPTMRAATAAARRVVDMRPPSEVEMSPEPHGMVRHVRAPGRDALDRPPPIRELEQPGEPAVQLDGGPGAHELEILVAEGVGGPGHGLTPVADHLQPTVEHQRQ